MCNSKPVREFSYWLGIFRTNGKIPGLISDCTSGAPKLVNGRCDGPPPVTTGCIALLVKSWFVAVKHLRDASGFGWDNGLHMVTATDEVWDAYLKSHPKSKWRKTPFPLYNNILYLVKGIIATGAGAFQAGSASQVSGMSQTQSESETQTQTQLETPRGRSIGQAFQTPVDEELTASSPVRPRRKRPASSSPDAGGRSNRKGRKRNAESVSEITSALLTVAGSLKTITSPEIRERAVKQMEDDRDFSEDEGANIMMLFTENFAVTQTFLASLAKERRTAFLTNCLRKAEREGRL
ncbi:hypothetical protein DFH07DRAFT_985750 [Mycena maculata]|uniref:Myb/SANT-like domain-containing protein n=1 Tax=Mycena maculata TaxID=230809 RepID=A0AAD7I842_9AGAR|nr:hypothetical protein DFH07DRAFT_985750 [Mycena maculata]